MFTERPWSETHLTQTSRDQLNADLLFLGCLYGWMDIQHRNEDEQGVSGGGRLWKEDQRWVARSRCLRSVLRDDGIESYL